jgi:glycosyltransferase involved in cell wall biosynthesis
MRILFVVPKLYLPQNFGGIGITVDSLAHGLTSRGHDVAVVTSLARGDLVWLKWAFKKALRVDHDAEQFGTYLVYRTRDIASTVKTVVDAFRPDVLVGHRGIPNEITHIPTALHLHDVASVRRSKTAFEQGVRHFICCSSFIASLLAKTLPQDPRAKIIVIYNPIEHDNYRTYRSYDSARFITLINPIRAKGVDVALELARSLRQESFLFVKGWRYASIERRVIRAARALGNITIRRSTQDMKSVYRDTKVLLMPSQVEEGAGRVITEAQINGIPVLASNIGGVPEIIGAGGILLPHDDTAAWVRTVKQLIEDPGRLSALSSAAEANSLLPKFSMQKALDEYEDLLCSISPSRPDLESSAPSMSYLQ